MIQMQRWVLVRDGLVRCYLLTEGEPDDAAKRLALFGAEPDDLAPQDEGRLKAAELPDLVAEGEWMLAPAEAGLVGDGWRLTPEGRLQPPPVVEAGPRIVSGADFLALFTTAEVAAMWQSGPEFMVAALRIAAQNEVNLDSRDLSRLLALAVGRNALSSQRLPRIVAGLPPA